MDAARFDRLTVAVAHRATRRSALALLSALGLGALLAGEALACAEEGTSCLQSEDCCSGLCKKKRHGHKKFCRAAPGQGICSIGEDYCGSASSTLPCGSTECECARRMNGASVCAFPPGPRCAFAGDCTDAKCRKLLGSKKAFCGLSDPTSGCCDGAGVCFLPCENPDKLS